MLVADDVFGGQRVRRRERKGGRWEREDDMAADNLFGGESEEKREDDMAGVPRLLPTGVLFGAFCLKRRQQNPPSKQ